MDTESDYELGITSTEPSTPGEIFSIESLIERVEEFQRRDHLDTLEKLTVDGGHLQQRILRYQEEWCSTLDLLQQVYESVGKIQAVLARCYQEQMEAERLWLAVWQIKRNGPKDSGYSPTGWV